MWVGTRLPSVEIMHKDVRESDIKTSLLLLQSAEESWRKDDRLLVVCSLAELWLYVPPLPLSFSLPLSTHLRTILSLSWGTTLVTVDINTLLCHWVCSAQKWKYLTGTIYRPCRRTGKIHSNTIQPILESCSTEIASAERSCKARGPRAQLGHGGGFFFVIERWWQLWVGKAVVECTNESDTFDCKEKQKKWKCTRIHRCVPLLASVLLPWSCADIHTTLVRIYTMYSMHVLMMRTVCVPAHAIWLTFRCYALLKMNHTHQQHESVIWGRSAWWTDLLQASCVILRIGTQVERRDRWIMKSNLGACCPLSPPWLCKSEKESANTQGLRRGRVSPSFLRSTVETCARLI